MDGKKVASQLRLKLRDRMVVLHWRCAEMGSDCQRKAEEVQDSDLFWFVGHVNMTTMHVAGLKMQPCQLGQQDVLQLIPAEPLPGIEERFSHGLCTEAEWIASELDLQKQWILHVCLISLQEAHWMVEDMTPVPVVWSADSEPFKIWSGEDTKPSAKKQKAGPKREPAGPSRKLPAKALQDTALDESNDMLERLLLQKKPERRASAQQFVGQEEEGENPQPKTPHPYLEADEADINVEEFEFAEDVAPGQPDDWAAGSANDCSSSEEEGQQEQQEVADAAHVPDADAALARREGAVAVQRVAGPRDRESTQVFETSDGTLRYYPQHKYVTAFCKHHFECRRSRTVKGKDDARTSLQRGQGRCVGALAAWLELHHQFASAHDHVHQCMPTATQRVEARERLYTMRGGEDFARSCERPQREGEDLEPAVFR